MNFFELFCFILFFQNLHKVFKKYLAPQLHLRVTPDLQFIYDETLEYSEKIEELIKSIKDKEKNDS